MAELMSNEEVSQLGIYAGVGLTAGAIGVAYGIDSKNPKVKAAKPTKDKVIADAIVESGNENRISNVDKAWKKALKENAAFDNRTHQVNSARSRAESIRQNAFNQSWDDAHAENAQRNANRAHNEQLRAAQKNAPKPIGAREEAWVASGLAQTESHLDYLRGLPQDTIDIMQKAHHHAENNNYMKVRPMSQAGRESALGFNKVIKAARAVSRAL